jgi:parallel beta helix pectate lyase-like protein
MTSVQRRSDHLPAMFCFGCFLVLGAAAQTQASGQLIIQNESNKVYKDLSIATDSRSGQDCIIIRGSTNITIEDSQIRPCGGNGVNISGGSGIQIYDNYIHPETHVNACCDYNDGVLAQNTSQITIQGNVIAYGESNVEMPQDVTGLIVIGNFHLNPLGGDNSRGQNVQAWNSTNVVVLNNYTLSSQDRTEYRYPEDQEDSINFGFGSGFVAIYNYITGGHSPSGCGLIADEAANSVLFVGNELLDTGQCGVGIASGSDQLVDHNKILNRTPVNGGGNTALYVWSQYPEPCGPVSVSHNIATEIRKDGTQSGFWNGGGCDPLTQIVNTWNAAAQQLLTPPATKMPPPLIPPQPRDCVAKSPYSTQTDWPVCE